MHLPLQDYQRFGRQMILDGIGLPGQIKMREAAVVVVGAGGLGCPALQYMAAAGIGRIGIIDHDRVELSNLQRQILHNEKTLGMYKAESAAEALKRIDSGLKIDVMTVAICAENALELLRPYDIILDCTDNMPTRYLLSDVAVALGKPLVSGAAQKLEGQLSVFNLGPNGPCYRCLYPKPPPRDAVGSCEELGILGAVTGVIGNLQAVETIKIILGQHDSTPSLLLYSAFGFPPFRTVKLRQRKADCPTCSNPAENSLSITNTDYVQFCGGVSPNWVEAGSVAGIAGHRIRAKKLQELLSSNVPLKVIDVRPRTEYEICQLPGSENVPLKDILTQPEKYILANSNQDIYVVCRLGNDSQLAADALRRIGSGATVRDVVGGLRAWSKNVDPEFPIY